MSEWHAPASENWLSKRERKRKVRRKRSAYLMNAIAGIVMAGVTKGRRKTIPRKKARGLRKWRRIVSIELGQIVRASEESLYEAQAEAEAVSVSAMRRRARKLPDYPLRMDVVNSQMLRTQRINGKKRRRTGGTFTASGARMGPTGIIYSLRGRRWRFDSALANLKRNKDVSD